MSLSESRLLQHLLPSVGVAALELRTPTPSPSLLRNFSTPPFKFVPSIRRVPCTCTTIQASSPNTHFAAVDYLVQSCGLSSDEALKASKSIQHLKSPDKPDSVLQFLRDIGVSEGDIRTAVSQCARILCSGLESNWIPNVAKLQEVGFSITDISGIIACQPYIFLYNFASKLDFWIQTLGSADYLPMVLKYGASASLLTSSLENVLIPNVSFLTEKCGFSTNQIVRLIKSNARLISSRPDILKRQAARAEELGVARLSGTFPHALNLVSYLNQGTMESRINNLKSLGLSQEEVTTIVSKLPLVLSHTEEMIGRKVEFLLNEFGGDKLQLLSNPSLLTYSLDMRIIPRNLVRKLLKSKRIAVGDLALTSFVRPSEEQFLVKFIVPYEDSIPGLRQAYVESIARGTAT